MSAEACSWCGVPVPADDGFRLSDPVHRRHAAFCRLEHVVPWCIRTHPPGPFSGGSGLPTGDPGQGLGRCAECGAALGDQRLLLIRHRGQHRIGDAFCGLAHLEAWARAGGRFRTGRRS